MSKFVDLKHTLSSYVEKFNRDDVEYYKQDIDNSKAEQWMLENIPYFACPDKTLEEIYYFRWWTARKHIRTTQDGTIITEFLPNVPWAWKNNAIVAPVGHHISEFRWLKCGKKVLADYIRFWMKEQEGAREYSTWLLYSIYEFCVFNNDFSLGIECLDDMISFYEKMADEHKTASGLFWSVDGRDAMEYSISGRTPDFRFLKGARPTLNSYMAANALAISRLAQKATRKDVAEKYLEEYERIKDLLIKCLWDGSFFKAVHKENIEQMQTVSTKDIDAELDAKELIGYIPWCFNLAPDEFSFAFDELKSKDGFCSPYGLTSAERRHSRYLYEHPHECLWNGYIWPYATSQVLNALINLLNNYNQSVITKEDFYNVLKVYADSQYITEDGKTVCWIDEVKHPETNIWSSRDILLNAQATPYERGKDYNHSTFCDIVIRGLLGVNAENGEVSVKPNIPNEWEYFMLDNLWICGKKYTVIYDEDGTHFGYGKGLTVKNA